MFVIEWISFPRFAMVLCLSIYGISSNPAFAQRYYTVPSAPAYTHVTSNLYRKPMWPEPGRQSSFRAGMPQQVVTATSPPVATTIQTVSATGPIYAPPPTPNAVPQEPWAGAPPVVSPPSESPVYYSNPVYHQVHESSVEQPCDWLCQSKKKLRSLWRASHRRSDCHFEYPVAPPSGSPYGYVEPTWNDFGTDVPVNAIELGY